MSVSTYTELLTAVEAYTDRTDVATVFPMFLDMVESALNRRLSDPDQEVISTSTASSDYTALPADFGEMVSVTTGTGHSLRPIGAAEYAGIDEAIAGTERFYVIVDGSIGFYPRNSTAAIRMVYRRTIPPLTAAAPTNWLLSRAPDVYFSGVMFHEAEWEKEREDAARWESRFERNVADLMADGARRKWGAGAIAPRIRRT